MVDVKGLRFGRLLVLDLMAVRVAKKLIWKCLCDCGNITHVISSNLRRGTTQSCGCYMRDRIAETQRAKALPAGERARRVAEARRRKFAEDPETAIHHRIANGLREALTNIGRRKNAPTFIMVGYSPKELKDHLERQFKGGMSWANRNKWHIDHIIPICTAKTKEDIVRLNQLSNLRPIWAVDNLRKNGKRLFLV